MRDGAVVIDVGINRVDDATRSAVIDWLGDVAFAEVSPKAVRDHASARRRRADDDRDADGEYGEGLPARCSRRAVPADQKQGGFKAPL